MDDKGTILVVDDDDVIRRGLQRMLRGQGYTVDVAESAEIAQQLLPRTLYDMVITDLQMPGEDGLSLLQHIKARHSHVPVMMLTGHGSMDVVVEALRYGASDFLTKPYKPDELFSIVDREVARYRQSLPPGVAEGLSLQLSETQSDEVDHILLGLRAEVNARAVLIIEGNGSVIAAKGAIDDLNVSALGALVAGDFAATAGIASLLGEDEAFQLNFHEGAQYSIYSGQIMKSVYLLVVFGQDIRLGAVLYYTKGALTELAPLFENSVVKSSVTASPTPVSAPVAPSSAPNAEGPPSQAAPVVPQASEPAELFSFEDIMESGMLDSDLLSSLEQQFDNLWDPD